MIKNTKSTEGALTLRIEHKLLIPLSVEKMLGDAVHEWWEKFGDRLEPDQMLEWGNPKVRCDALGHVIYQRDANLIDHHHEPGLPPLVIMAGVLQFVCSWPRPGM